MFFKCIGFFFLDSTIVSNTGIRYIQPLGLFINNEFVKSQSGETLSTINPTTEEEITSVYAADAADVDLAVKAARDAFKDPSWSELTPEARGKLLYKLAELVEKNAETLATIGIICYKNCLSIENL